MKNISFAMTTDQFLDGSKTVTRRLGWMKLKSGDVLCAVEKSQGLKKGETVKKLGTIRVVDVRREQIRAMRGMDDYEAELSAEGFPTWSPEDFITMFCDHNGCTPDTLVTRIEFERLT